MKRSVRTAHVSESTKRQVGAQCFETNSTTFNTDDWSSLPQYTLI